MSESSPKPTVFSVAARAGVSVASVSRVLNGLPASPAMARRVREAAEELRYVPDAVARSLKARRTQQLSFAVADVGNPVFVAMMRAIEQVTKAAGYRLLLHSTGSDRQVELDLLRSLAHGYVDGMILCPLRVTDDHLAVFSETAVPLVVVGMVPEGVPVDNVRADSRLGMRLAVDHLLSGGRTRIGFLNGPPDTVPGAARREGYEAALGRVGRPVDPALISSGGDFTHDEGYRAALRLFERRRVDALVCANDLIAVGAMRALAESGARVPDDVAVVGMDDTDLAQMCFPTLTSVSLGSQARGRMAAELLLGRLADPSRQPSRVTIPPRLAVRESSGPGEAGTIR
jgi:LacI family transcriptional regulator